MESKQPESARILVVDDEPSVRRFLRACLLGNGYQVGEASTGVEAIESVRKFRPDLVLLDLGLPDLDGKEVTRVIREWSNVPIIVLSVRDQETEKVDCLDSGANDYLTKPFGVNELQARMRVALRQSSATQIAPVVVTGDLSVDLSHRSVLLRGEPVSLTPTEYDLLRSFVQEPGKVLTHRHLMHQVWGLRGAEDLHILRVNISNLRRKIEDDPGRPRYLMTEAGVGYRLRMLEPG